jgi:hypothetical protein
VVVIGVAALGLAIAGAAWIEFPPHPVVPWILEGYPVNAATRWWYSLPEARRTQDLYGTVVGIAGLLYPFLLAATFAVWCLPLRRDTGLFPQRTQGLALVTLLGSIAWYVVGWKYGREYQGTEAILSCLALTALFLAVLAYVWTRGKERNSWVASLLVHLGIFLWIVGFAFPWLGEPCC